MLISCLFRSFRHYGNLNRIPRKTWYIFPPATSHCFHKTARCPSDNNKGGALEPTVGQHFLESPEIVEAIVKEAGVKPTDVVLEIGPGTGNLTLPLLVKSQQVMALEYDLRMVAAVQQRVEGTPYAKKLNIIRGDALKTPWPTFDLMVANLPYQISTKFMYKLLGYGPVYRSAVLMFQEEFALRLVAKPKDTHYGRLSVDTQLLCDVELLLPVGKENFRPPPQVESRVVRITPKASPPAVDMAEWDAFVRLLFNRKHKTMRAVLTTKTVRKMLEDNVKYSELSRQTDGTKDRPVFDAVEEILQRDAWIGKRAAKLGLDELLKLLSEFNEAGVFFSK